MSKMLEEVREQPAALDRTLRSELKKAEKLRAIFTKNRPKLIMLAARGTSDNAAQFGRYLLELTTGIPVSLSAPSLFTLYDTPMDFSGALCVAISQSGESTDTNVVLERARAGGAVTIGVTNEASSSMARLAEHVFLVRAGKEKSVAATKTYTGQVLCMYLLAYALGADLDPEDFRKIPEWVAQTLTLEPAIAERAERYRFMQHAVVAGRGLNYANAFEFALKLMETCYVIAERFSSADFQHGPIAMVDQSFPMFLFAPSGVTWPGMRDMIAKLTTLKAETLLIRDQSNKDAAKLKAREIVLPMSLPELYTPIPYIIPAQLFAGRLAAVKGLNPDQPRTIQKITLTM